MSNIPIQISDGRLTSNPCREHPPLADAAVTTTAPPVVSQAAPEPLTIAPPQPEIIQAQPSWDSAAQQQRIQHLAQQVRQGHYVVSAQRLAAAWLKIGR